MMTCSRRRTWQSEQQKRKGTRSSRSRKLSESIMADDRPADLEQLRAAANEDARAILDRIWDYYWENRRWISAMVLHSQFDMAKVAEALRPLGGTVVQTIWEIGEECYMLRFLGVLLSHRGREAEKILIRYFD